jgi:RluA family pseudouridine synthase
MIGDNHYRVAARCELLPYLMSLPLGLSRKRAKDLLRFRSVTVKGNAQVRHDTVLLAGDIVSIQFQREPRAAELERHGLKIVHLDDAIVVVDKPAGLLSMGSEREKKRTAYRLLHEQLKAQSRSSLQQIFIVHRLDRETSGLMLFARSDSIQTALRQDWKNVSKKYFAIVEGAPPNAIGILKHNLIESKSLKVRVVEGGGQLAVAHYRLLGRHGDRSMLELSLETGRKNQLRVQLAAVGSPIVGDRKYGALTDPVHRLALHSCELKISSSGLWCVDGISERDASSTHGAYSPPDRTLDVILILDFIRFAF